MVSHNSSSGNVAAPRPLAWRAAVPDDSFLGYEDGNMISAIPLAIYFPSSSLEEEGAMRASAGGRWWKDAR